MAQGGKIEVYFRRLIKQVAYNLRTYTGNLSDLKKEQIYRKIKSALTEYFENKIVEGE